MNSGGKARLVLADESIFQSVRDLTDPAKKAQALERLKSVREQVEDLPRILWFSVGTITALLQEIVSVYPHLHISPSNPSGFNKDLSERACSALALLQCVACDPETRPLLIEGVSTESCIDYLH
jgi:CCR4-NOT transcription complex subunit 9